MFPYLTIFMLEKIKIFFVEARQEFRHVNWPTRAEAVKLTTVVIGISLALAVFLGFFDGVFKSILEKLIGV